MQSWKAVFFCQKITMPFFLWDPKSITYCPREEETTCTVEHGGASAQEGQHKPMTSKMKLQTGNAPQQSVFIKNGTSL